MRRLMTGHAVTFNKRHKRSGHLFQNRYKSIVCEEDSYLLELIRYIHLNPLRAGLVKDIKELDKYPWTGHSAILGKRRNPLVPCPSSRDRFTSLSCSEGAPKGIQLGPEKPEKYLAEKTIEDVLLQFGNKLREARRRYRQFVKNGIAQGTLPELQGGGLLRSAGGDKKVLLQRKRRERELSDERILGSGNFVTTVLEKSHQADLRKREKMPLELLSRKVASHFKIKEEDLRSNVKRKSVTEAKSAFGYIAIKKMGYSGREIGRFLNMRSYSAIRRAQEGKKVIDKSGLAWDTAEE